MSVTPTGILSLPLSYLRATLAGSATFQSWTGAADADAALAFILPVLAKPEDIDPPFIVLDWQSFTRNKQADSHFNTAGTLQIAIIGPIDQAHEDADAAFEFLNKVGAILAEAEALAPQPDYLNWDSLALTSLDRPSDQERQSSGDFYQAMFTLTYEDDA